MGEAAQKTTTLDALEGSLDDLLKAAGAHASLRKAMGGVDIDTYGHTDERGKTSGGYAEASDAGKPIDLSEEAIVGKMSEAGMNAAQVAHVVGYMKRGGMFGRAGAGIDAREHPEGSGQGGEFFDHERPSPSGKMKGKAQKPPMPPFTGKADDDMDDEDEGDEDEGGEQPPFMGKGKMRKSFREDFLGDQDIADTVDVSPFLEAVTTKTVEALDGIASRLHKSESRQGRYNESMAKAMYQIGGLLKSQARVIDALSTRLGIVERTPNAPKGALTGAQAMQKSLGANNGGGASLKKSEVLSTLSYMRMSKGMKDINGRAIQDVIYALDGGGIIQPEDIQSVERFLATHPAEADKAKSFT